MSLATLAKNLLSSLGYGGLFVGLVVDSAGVPIPSEVLLPLAGALVRQGRFNMVLVIALATLAQTMGAVLAYWVGALGGLPLVERYGKYVMFRQHELAKTHALFERYGAWLSLAGRCLPGIRTYIGYPAGVARMRFDIFLAASILGSLIWTVFLTLLGYVLADKLDLIDRYLGPLGILIMLFAIILFARYVHQSRKH